MKQIFVWLVCKKALILAYNFTILNLLKKRQKSLFYEILRLRTQYDKVLLRYSNALKDSKFQKVFLLFCLLCVAPIWSLNATNAMSKISIISDEVLDLQDDLMSKEEILQKVAKTKRHLLARLVDEKLPDSKDERNQFYASANMGFAFNVGSGLGYYVGAQAGYNFLIQQDNSLRVFIFVDRFGNAIGNYHISYPQGDFSIWRVGISAEYRAYFHRHFGFKARLISYGARSLNHKYVSGNPRIEREIGFLPTIALGPIFSYKDHEVFVGFDMLDYDLKDSFSANFLQYSFKF